MSFLEIEFKIDRPFKISLYLTNLLFWKQKHCLLASKV